MIKRAVIFAGGKGKRLRPYTYVVPKPLMPIGQKPILELIIRQLGKIGINHITISIFNNSELFQSIFSKKSFSNIKIDFLVEKKPMGTIGGLRLIKNLPKEFLAMNGDLITNLNFKDFYKFHKKNKSDLTICTKTLKENIEYGVIKNNKKKILTKFEEKPSYKYQINLGIYIIKKDLVKRISTKKDFGFDKLIKKINDKKVFIYNSNCKWFDIGRKKDLFDAQNFLLKSKKF
tara:strand:- start:44 stop:739 length:696 start_codon:yes stop_codon:yes gene_type:complete